MNEITLSGCSASSLSSYLKALGILRLITDQLDNTARGHWNGDRFILKTKYSRDELAAYFLTKYSPSPILSPWNGRAGFLEGEDDGPSTRKGAVTISRVERSSGSRFRSYRNLIAAIRNVSAIAHLDRARARQKALEKKKKATGLDEAEDRQLKDLKKQMEELKVLCLMHCVLSCLMSSYLG